MRTTIIPAQITTVEDKIIGNYSFMQVGILMIPIFLGIFIFVLIPPIFRFAWYKLPPELITILICLLLSVRVKGVVMANFLVTIIRYNMRPRYYIFNKNDAYARNIPSIKETSIVQKQKEQKKAIAMKAQSFGLKELKQWETYINNPNYSFSLKPNKKGVLYVVVSQVK